MAQLGKWLEKNSGRDLPDLEETAWVNSAEKLDSPKGLGDLANVHLI